MKALSAREVSHLENVSSPALLVWPEQVQANIDHMVKLCGGAQRLRPHVKTHKMDAVVRLQMTAGITRFKASTIAELDMCLAAGVRDVLLAYPVVGPNRDRLVKLARSYPDARMAFIADSTIDFPAISTLCIAANVELGVFVDWDCGMTRTGTSSVSKALELAKTASTTSGLHFAGVHVYDGHIRHSKVPSRRGEWSAAMASVEVVLDSLAEHGIAVGEVVGGGSPTFGFHAGDRGWHCSPGTVLFWDHGYGSAFPDLPFETAAMVLTRIVSKPGTNRLCLDLGHKAIASEGPLDGRVHLPGLESARVVGHSEEHLVLEIAEKESYAVGDTLLGVPHHICPTVALHEEAILVRDGAVTGESWKVTARNRKLTV